MAHPRLRQTALALNSQPFKRGDGKLCSSLGGARPNPSSCAQLDDELLQSKVEGLETVNFFLMNVLGEATLIQGMKSLIDQELDDEVRCYLRRLISEEQEHSSWFNGFVSTYSERDRHELIRGLHLSQAVAQNIFEFMLFVYLFEEIVCSINQEIASDPDGHPLVRRLNKAHFEDEIQHLAFGRRWLKEHLATETHSDEIIHKGELFIEAFWVDYANPAIYRLAGVPNPEAFHMALVCSDRFESFKQRHSRRARRFLTLLRGMCGNRAA